ncbi:unnamed protein product [Chironomus riparius]|uniref:Uncharacterized protein n=1 Tax=Chironomus riparius TaxID=315576 RepID=A0A9N9RFX9_9DIPT|nr:unnamed protein product [Chironomus riparius]
MSFTKSVPILLILFMVHWIAADQDCCNFLGCWCDG